MTERSPTRVVRVRKLVDGAQQELADSVSRELPIALKYGGNAFTVSLATPCNLEDFAHGFTLSEGLVSKPEEILSVRIAHAANSAEIDVAVPFERQLAILKVRRNLPARSACGLCGYESLDDVVRATARVGEGVRVNETALLAAVRNLSAWQPINARTGSVHAAAWVHPEDGIALVREDVGRHNALDKAIGALARQRVAFDSGFLLLTSRASFEMVQKAATVGITFIAAISAPTALAIQRAVDCGITLIGFARPHQYVVYSDSPGRLQ